MISSKDRLYKVVWDIIQEIKEEGLIVPDDEWILIDTPNDERRRALRYLDRLGAVKALEYGLLGPSSKVIRQINGEIHKVNVYKVDILRLKFDKIYEKFRKENETKDTIRSKEIIKGKSLLKKGENITEKKRLLSENMSITEVRIAEDQFNKGFKIRGINEVQKLAHNKKDERDILYLDSNGNLYRKLKNKRIVYSMSAGSDRFKIIEYLSKNRRYCSVDEILPNKRPQNIRTTIAKIKKNIEKYLKIKGNDFIQSKRDSGYRVNPKYRVKVKK